MCAKFEPNEGKAVTGKAVTGKAVTGKVVSDIQVTTFLILVQYFMTEAFIFYQHNLFFKVFLHTLHDIERMAVFQNINVRIQTRISEDLLSITEHNCSHFSYQYFLCIF